MPQPQSKSSAAPKPKSAATRRTIGRYFTKEDIVLAAGVVLGFLTLVAVVVYVPAKKLSLDSLTRVFTGKSKPSIEVVRPGSEGSGLYRFGQCNMTLGDASGYINSELVLEYDKATLRVSTAGEVDDENSANDFFGDQKSKLRDAILSGASGYSWDELSNGKTDDLKISLLSEMNIALQHGEEPITNIYFQKYILYDARDG